MRTPCAPHIRSHLFAGHSDTPSPPPPLPPPFPPPPSPPLTVQVRDPRAVVTDNIHAILAECVSVAATGEAWREREAACLALNDALFQRSAGDVLPHLRELWSATMRSIDDVKDSVREAAMMLLKVRTGCRGGEWVGGGWTPVLRCDSRPRRCRHPPARDRPCPA
jgi:hypothetical protein